MIFWGPLPGISAEYLKIDLLYFCILVTIQNFGAGFTIVSSFSRIQEASIQLKFVQDIKTYLFLSSLWSSFFFLSDFSGYTFGGILIDYIGLRMTTAVLLTLNILTFFVDIYDFVTFNQQNVEYSTLSDDE